MQPRILYPARISFKIEGEINFFQQTKAKRIQEYKTQAKRNIERASLKQKRKDWGSHNQRAVAQISQHTDLIMNKFQRK